MIVPIRIKELFKAKNARTAAGVDYHPSTWDENINVDKDFDSALYRSKYDADIISTSDSFNSLDKLWLDKA